MTTEIQTQAPLRQPLKIDISLKNNEIIVQLPDDESYSFGDYLPIVVCNDCSLEVDVKIKNNVFVLLIKEQSYEHTITIGEQFTLMIQNPLDFCLDVVQGVIGITL